LKLRNNIILLVTLLFGLGILFADKLVGNYHYLVLIGFICVLLGGVLSLFKPKKTTALLILLSPALISIGFLLHYLELKEMNRSKIYLNQNIICKSVVESSSFSNAGNVKLELRSVYLITDKIIKKQSFKFLAYVDSKSLKTNIGDTVYFKSKINSFNFYNNPWEFDFGKYNERKGIVGYVFLCKNNFLFKKGRVTFLDGYRFRAKLNQLLTSDLKGQELEVCKAFLWGDREGLSEEVLDAFSNTGTIHILAVSGLHVGILFTLIIHFFKLFGRWISKFQATLITIVIAWVYAYITGFSPSILRSVIVFSLIFFNEITQKKRNDLMLMSLSALMLLVYDSNYLFDLGFQLTYAALIGIYVFYPYFKNIYKVKNKLVDYFYSPMMLGFSAQLTTLPIILFNFHQFPNYFTITNILLVPFSFLIISLGMAFYLFSFSTFLKLWIGKALFIVVHLMISIVSFFDKMPFAVAKQFDFDSFDFILFVVILLYFYFILLTKNKQHLFYFTLISFIFCSFVQYKRYKKIDESYVAKIGNSFAILAKNNFESNYFIDKNYLKEGELNRIKKFYQTKFNIIDLKRDDYLLINNLKLVNTPVNNFENKFQILKKW
jgi:competence protein ComEC